MLLVPTTRSQQDIMPNKTKRNSGTSIFMILLKLHNLALDIKVYLSDLFVHKQTINVKRGSWMLQGDRAVSMSMQNATNFLQRQQGGSQTNAQPNSAPNPTPTPSSSIASGSRSILGHKYKGLQWKGFDAVTGRQLQEIRDKRKRKD